MVALGMKKGEEIFDVVQRVGDDQCGAKEQRRCSGEMSKRPPRNYDTPTYRD